jgi:hypothetical protein
MSLTKYVLGSFAVAGGLVYHAMKVGPDRKCQIVPAADYAMPFSSRNEGSTCVSMTWRAISGGP